MSKNIKVQRDGVTETFTGVKKIQTINENGSVTWVPLDETELAIKTVNQNGTYKASSDGYYGYRQVTVSTKNKGKTIGTKSDGRTYSVDTDNDGWLTEKLLPDNIRINPQPTKTTYRNGESISLSGAVVKAYSKNDIWNGEGYSGGVIPHGEITLDPSTASGGGGGETVVIDDTSGLVNVETFPPPYPIARNAVVSVYFTSRYEDFECQNNGEVIVCGGTGVNSSSFFGFIVKGASSVTVKETSHIEGRPDSVRYLSSDLYVTVDGERYGIWYTYYSSHVDITGIGLASTTSTWGENKMPFFYNVLYGMKHGTISGGGEASNVSVKWNRPEDEAELTTSFSITVS